MNNKALRKFELKNEIRINRKNRAEEFIKESINCIEKQLTELDEDKWKYKKRYYEDVRESLIRRLKEVEQIRIEQLKEKAEQLKNEIDATDISTKYFAECIEKGEIPKIEKAAEDIEELMK